MEEDDDNTLLLLLSYPPKEEAEEIIFVPLKAIAFGSSSFKADSNNFINSSQELQILKIPTFVHLVKILQSLNFFQ